MKSELQVVVGLMQKSVEENARIALNQAEYLQQYNGMTERYEKAKARLAEVIEGITDKNSRCETINSFIAELGKQGGLISEFDERLWHSLLDFATVYSGEDVRFTFKNGTTIQA